MEKTNEPENPPAHRSIQRLRNEAIVSVVLTLAWIALSAWCFWGLDVLRLLSAVFCLGWVMGAAVRSLAAYIDARMRASIARIHIGP